MHEHLHLITNHGDYQSKVFYTDDPPDPDAHHPTEWIILRMSDHAQVATGWASTPKQAREKVDLALAELRSAPPPRV